MDGWMDGCGQLMPVDIDDMIDQTTHPFPTNGKQIIILVVVKHFIDSTESTLGVKLQDLLLL